MDRLTNPALYRTALAPGAAQAFDAVAPELKASLVPKISGRRLRGMFPFLGSQSQLVIMREVGSVSSARLLGTVTEVTALGLLAAMGPAGVELVGDLPLTLAMKVVASVSLDEIELESLSTPSLKLVLTLVSDETLRAAYAASTREGKISVLQNIDVHRAAAMVHADPSTTTLLADMPDARGADVFNAYQSLERLATDINSSPPTRTPSTSTPDPQLPLSSSSSQSPPASSPFQRRVPLSTPLLKPCPKPDSPTTTQSHIEPGRLLSPTSAQGGGYPTQSATPQTSSLSLVAPLATELSRDSLPSTPSASPDSLVGQDASRSSSATVGPGYPTGSTRSLNPNSEMLPCPVDVQPRVSEVGVITLVPHSKREQPLRPSTLQQEKSINQRSRAMRLHDVVLSTALQQDLFFDGSSLPVNAIASAIFIEKIQTTPLASSLQAAALGSLLDVLPKIQHGHPFAQVIRDIEDPATLLPLGRMLTQNQSLCPADFKWLVIVMEFSVRRQMFHLRSMDISAVKIDPWLLLRTAAVYRGAATCLGGEENPHVGRGIVACDEVVQTFAAVAWTKRLCHIVIPAVRKLEEDAGSSQAVLWPALVQLLEDGVKSLASCIAVGRSDMFSHKNLATRCTQAIEAAIEDLLGAVRWVGDDPLTQLPVTTRVKLWHPGAELLRIILNIETSTWEIWSFLDRILTLLLVTVGCIQLHQQLGSNEGSRGVETSWIVALEKLGACVKDSLNVDDAKAAAPLPQFGTEFTLQKYHTTLPHSEIPLSDDSSTFASMDAKKGQVIPKSKTAGSKQMKSSSAAFTSGPSFKEGKRDRSSGSDGSAPGPVMPPRRSQRRKFV